MTIVLTAFPSGSPAPYVQVDVDDTPAAAVRLTVWRTVGGRQMRVRGLVDVAADGASGLDFEAPFGVEVSYRAEYFDAIGGLLGWSDPAAVTLSGLSGSEAWVHNPLDPQSAVRVTMMSGAAGSIVRPTQARTFQIPGRSVGVVLAGTRKGVTGVRLDCYCETQEQADRFDALFGGYDDFTVPILCFRTVPGMRLPAPLFALIGEPEQIPHNYAGADSVEWRLAGDEVSPPTEALVVALLDYADFTAFYSATGTNDYEEFTNSYADYTEAQRDYSIAGSA